MQVSTDKMTQSEAGTLTVTQTFIKKTRLLLDALGVGIVKILLQASRIRALTSLKERCVGASHHHFLPLFRERAFLVRWNTEVHHLRASSKAAKLLAELKGSGIHACRYHWPKVWHLHYVLHPAMRRASLLV